MKQFLKQPGKDPAIKTPNDSAPAMFGHLNTIIDDITKLSSSENFIYISSSASNSLTNGINLTTAYTEAITKKPNGSPLSENNRYTILLAPGVYEVPTTIFWDTDFIDLACIEGVATLKHLPALSNPTPIFIGANNARFNNINIQFPFIETTGFIGWPVRPNKSKVLLNNCSGNFNVSGYSEEYTINRDYLNTTVSRRILQNCLTSFNLYLGLNYVNLDPSSIAKTQFFWSETTNLFAQSKFDIGAVGDSVWFSQGQAFTYAYMETQSLPLSDKYIYMNISNVVGTFAVNDVVDQGGVTGIITETDGSNYFTAYVATGVFPNGTGSITNTTSGSTADNNGWVQNGNSSFNGNALGFNGNGNLNFMDITLVNYSGTTNYVSQAGCILQFFPQIYILYEGPNTSFDPNSGVSVIYNELGGTAYPLFSTNAGELVISNLSGNWDEATQIWSDVNSTPVTITNRSQNIIHTLNKTVTNR